MVGGSSSIALSGQLIPDRLLEQSSFVSSALDLGESYLTTRLNEILKILRSLKIHRSNYQVFVSHCTSYLHRRNCQVIQHGGERRKEGRMMARLVRSPGT